MSQELTILNEMGLTRPENLEQLEHDMLQHEQVDCPVIHRFGPGIYIREVYLPAGILAIGHRQKTEHLNIMLKGKVLMAVGDGSLKEIEAPLIFTGQPGRKVGYIVEDTVWQNVYATEETDIETLENTYLDKSITWQEHEAEASEFRYASRQEDRDDYAEFLKETGLTESFIRGESEDESDMIAMPPGYNVSVRKSDIEGKGIFMTYPAKAWDLIGPASIQGRRTILGRYTNHSKNPNAVFMKDSNGDIYLMAKKPINGCRGGDQGEEVTVDYRQAMRVANLKLENK